MKIPAPTTGGFDPGGLDGGRGEEEESGFGDPGFDPGDGGLGRGAGSRNQPVEEEVPLPELGIPNRLSQVNAMTLPGVRGPDKSLSAQSTKSLLFNIVAVRALVPYQQQAKEFENKFENSIGYYPDRDRPVYQFLEVHRREIGADGNPVEAENDGWKDISQRVAYFFPQYYPPGLTQMPQGVFPTAPEVVAPENFDPIITQPIPPIALLGLPALCDPSGA